MEPALDPNDTALPWITKVVLFLDVVESVRIYARHEATQITRVRGLLQTLEARVVLQHGGTLFERRGDGLLAGFDDARQAAAAAHAAHRAAAAVAPSEAGGDDTLCLRVAIHRTALIFEAGAAYGQGLNIAARLMGMALPGQTILSETVRDDLVEPLDGELRDLGACHLRHLPAPVRCYQLLDTPAAQPPAAAGKRPAADRLDAAAPAASAPPGLPAPEKIRTRLAVLPLVPADARAPLPAAADVLVDQWITALSVSPMLQVTALMSIQAFKGRDVPPRAAGRHLQADFVLAGTLRSDSGERLLVSLALIHVDSGDPVWQHELSFQQGGIVDATHPAVADVAERLVDALMITEWRLAAGRPLPNLALHTLHLAAVGRLHRFARHEFEAAHPMLQALRDRVPRHPSPLAWLARWHVFRIVQGWSDQRERDSALALDYANRALEIDPGSSLALSMAGSVQAGVQLDMARARTYYDLALARNPNESLAWLLKGVAHGFMGEGEAAVEASERSLQLSPLDPLRFYYDSLSSAAAMGAQRYERAVELAERAIRGNCMHGSAYRTLAIAQSMLGRDDEACLTVQRLLAVEPGSSVRQFVARAAVDSAQNRLFAQALSRAGLPPA